jgi:hypothetical protein
MKIDVAQRTVDLPVRLLDVVAVGVRAKVLPATHVARTFNVGNL